MDELGKWGWIALKLEEMHEHKLSEMAAEIDEHMQELYGTTITPRWSEQYEITVNDYNKLKHDDFKGKLRFLEDISTATKFCVACFKSNWECTECKYGETYGVCIIDVCIIDDLSEYNTFSLEIRNEINTERTGDDIIAHLF